MTDLRPAEASQPSVAGPTRRLMSLDALRGFDMFWIVGGEEIVHRSPKNIMAEIAALDAESAAVLAGIRKLL